MSHPPDYPGRQRLKRATARAGNDAYQGAFEAVGAVLVACGFGYWFDKSWDTGPWGLIVGVVIGFAAMVVRLIRLGKELDPDTVAARMQDEGMQAGESGPGFAQDEDLGTGESPGMSDVLRDPEPARRNESNDDDETNPTDR